MHKTFTIFSAALFLATTAAAYADDGTALLKRDEKVYLGTQVSTGGKKYFKPCGQDRFEVQPADKIVDAEGQQCSVAFAIGAIRSDGTLDRARLVKFTNALARLNRAVTPL
jgi:hypothetical protein